MAVSLRRDNESDRSIFYERLFPSHPIHRISNKTAADITKKVSA